MYGLYFNNAQDQAIVRNNTIADNLTAGIYLESGTEPDVSNCIIWGHPSYMGLVDCYPDYSCFEEANDPNFTGSGNINDDPCFINTGNTYASDDDYHLDPTSPCIDTADPDFTPDPNETDIDGEPRLMWGRVEIGRVDMGADEVPCFSTTDPNIAYEKWLKFGAPDCWCYDCFDCGDTNGDCGINYIPDVKFLLDHWDPNDYHPCGDFNRDGFITYIPDVKTILDHWDSQCADCGDCNDIDEGRDCGGGPEPPIKEQIESLKGFIDYFEKLCEENPSEEDIYDFYCDELLDFLYGILKDLVEQL